MFSVLTAFEWHLSCFDRRSYVFERICLEKNTFKNTNRPVTCNLSTFFMLVYTHNKALVRTHLYIPFTCNLGKYWGVHGPAQVWGFLIYPSYTGILKSARGIRAYLSYMGRCNVSHSQTYANMRLNRLFRGEIGWIRGHLGTSEIGWGHLGSCLLYTSPSPRD